MTVGVHTNTGFGGNFNGKQGTAFKVQVLETEMRDFSSPLAKFVDVGHTFALLVGDGTILRPYDMFPQAVNMVADGGVVSIVAGKAYGHLRQYVRRR